MLHIFKVKREGLRSFRVRDFLSFPKMSAERLQRIDLLRFQAMHAWNRKVFRKKRGMLILGRRPSDNVKDWEVSEYGPCPKCKQWMKKCLLYRHVNGKCIGQKNNDLHESTSEIVLSSDMIAGRVSAKASDALKKEVFPIMKTDNVKRVATEDPLIVQLGNACLNRNIGNKAMRPYYTSSVMRLLGKLLINLRGLQDSEESQRHLSMFDAINKRQYHNWVQAVLECCSILDEHDDEEGLDAPSNAIKLSYDIVRLVDAKICQAIDNDDEEQGEIYRKQAKRFMDKFRKNWIVDVKKKARNVLRERRNNTISQLPYPGWYRSNCLCPLWYPYISQKTFWTFIIY